jgi:hypothetical protein
VLLSGGNPQIAKGEGAAPVRASIAAMPGWKRDVGRRLDRLIGKTVPGVCRAVKWNSPFYGVEGRGYFLGYHCLTRYVKIAFFRGADLKPMPPGISKQKHVRYLDIYETTELDEELLADWIRQASELPGWVP